jgi:hypothetical protein
LSLRLLFLNLFPRNLQFLSLLLHSPLLRNLQLLNLSFSRLWNRLQLLLPPLCLPQ